MAAFTKAILLLSCTFLGLICGTLYLYSSYSPQFALRLHYSATNASTIALIGTLGSAFSGPFSGFVVDKRGYTEPLLVGNFFIMFGYIGLYFQYRDFHSSVPFLSFCLFLVGAGSTFMNLASLKCCAVNFPSIRGVATSLPLALYGLLGMFYSILASVFFSGDTQGFIRFLAISIGVIFSVCFPPIWMADRRRWSSLRTVHANEMIEMNVVREAKRKDSSLTSSSPGVHGFGLLYCLRFWLLFLITGTLASIGQMYIYSVGYMVRALIMESYHLAAEDTQSVPIDALIQQQQQNQVGLISIANCIGRLTAGVLGDVITQTFNVPRGILLFLPAAGLTAAQLMGQIITRHDSLNIVSVCVGFFYGFCFCVMPLIVGDVFGMENFASNWGLIGLAPIIPSFYFTDLFGRVFDSNSSPNEHGAVTCLLGRACYDRVFHLSLLVALFACFIVGVFNLREYVRAHSTVTKAKS